MHIVITGASSGLGRTLSLRMAQAGHQVFALARSEEKLRELADQHPDLIRTYIADVTVPGQVHAALDAILEEFIHIDVLINNASVFHSAEFAHEDIERIDRLIDTNLKGAMYCTLKVLPGMIEQGKGYIINIASVSGTHGIPQQAVYGASKHGVVGFSDVVAQEVKDKGVLVTAICPGGIDTPLWNEDNPYPGDESKLINPDEIADLIEFVLTHPKTTLYKKMIMFPTSEWHAG